MEIIKIACRRKRQQIFIENMIFGTQKTLRMKFWKRIEVIEKMFENWNLGGLFCNQRWWRIIIKGKKERDPKGGHASHAECGSPGVHVALYSEIDDGKCCSLSSDVTLSSPFSNSSPGLLAISEIWQGVISLEFLAVSYCLSQRNGSFYCPIIRTEKYWRLESYLLESMRILPSMLPNIASKKYGTSLGPRTRNHILILFIP